MRSTLQAPGDESGRPRLAIRLFGALEIADGERVLGARDLGGVRPKQLLEILVAARGHRVPTDRIADLIWNAQPPADIAASIQTFVSVLRRRLVADRNHARQLVVTEAEAYRFATDAVDLDLDRFDELLERSAREPTRVARRSLEQALSSSGERFSKTSPTQCGLKIFAAATRDVCSALALTQPMPRWRSWT